MDESAPVTLSFETGQLGGDCPESPGNVAMMDDSDGTFSDAVESMHEISAPSSSATAEDDVSFDGPSPHQSHLGWEMVDGKMAIAFFPDYILYRNIHCTDLKVIFSTTCVHVNGSTTSGNHGTISLELAVDDVIDIRSQWCRRSETGEVVIHVITRDLAQVGNINGIEELRFAVEDSCWKEKIDAIISLNIRYKAVWRLMLDTDAAVTEALSDQNAMLKKEKIFPLFDENFEELIYPEGDPDAVTISMRDVDLLKPDRFINDTIIDFYIKYLKSMIPPEVRHRFHFFNCFFFRKLVDLDKNPSGAFEGRAAFLRVRKWTRKLNLFEKDYLFIPVNYSYHWSLIVICHPGEVANLKDEEAERSSRVPCILHMDSLGGSHTNLKDITQSYLWEEWKERQKETVDDISSKFLNLRFVSLELPQQQNLYDCGLFLLHYVECFLDSPPANFSPFMMTELEPTNFLKVNWFPPDEPSTKRRAIIKLIHNLVTKKSQSPSSQSENCCSSKNPMCNNFNGNDFKLAANRMSPSKDGSEHFLLSDGQQGIGMDLLQFSSLCSSDSGLVLRESFEPTTSAALLPDAHYQAFGSTSLSDFRSGLPPIEEELDTDMRFLYTSSSEADIQHLHVITPEAAGLQNASKDYISASTQRISVEEKLHKNGSLLAKSTCYSDDTSVQAAEISPVAEASLESKVNHPVPVLAEYMEWSRSSGSTPGENVDVALLSPVRIHDLRDNADPPTSSLKNPLESIRQRDDNSVQENDGITCDNMKLVADDFGSQPDEHRPAKKLRLMWPLELQCGFTTSLSKDLM